MRELLLLSVQLIVAFARLMRPAGVRAVIAESLLLRHQLLICRRFKQRGPPLTAADGFLLGLTAVLRKKCTSLIEPYIGIAAGTHCGIINRC